jgi:hypothetical protein
MVQHTVAGTRGKPLKDAGLARTGGTYGLVREHGKRRNSE